jgi:hypothetical protein
MMRMDSEGRGGVDGKFYVMPEGVRVVMHPAMHPAISFQHGSVGTVCMKREESASIV